MFVLFRGFIPAIVMLMLSFPASAAEVTMDQMKSLDEQVQELKTETLSIGTQMRLLEEKLLYPSTSQLAVFVSLDKAARCRPDSIEIQLDGNTVTHYLYTAKELEALQKGGVQRIYTGNVKSGKHYLQVLLKGKSESGSYLDRKETFKFRKDAGAKMVEIHLINSDHVITVRDW